MKKVLVYFCLLGCFLPANAQWYKKALPVLAKKNPFVAVQRKATQAQQAINPAQQSVLQLIRNYHPHYGSLDDSPSSAFVIEENLQGTPRLWGVTVEHYHLVRPAVWHPSVSQAYPITLQAAGQSRYSDVVLFSLPPELRSKVPPLKLATSLPNPGEELTSYGYYHDDFRHLSHRKVKQVTPARLTTSYEFPPSVNKLGACGGPVLNAQNEVVGVHCGSYAPHNNSFAVPVTHIYRLLQAYYQHNQNTEPLLFNGKKIYALKVNQSVRQIISLRAEQEVEIITFFSFDAQLDPAHIENSLSTQEIDKLVFVIDQTDFSTNTRLPSFQLVYDLKTGKTEVVASN